MDRSALDLEFVNYETVGEAEKDFLHNILHGTGGVEYGKNLFSFNTPFDLNDVIEFGQGEGAKGGDSGRMAAREGNQGVVSASAVGPIMTIPPLVTVVSQASIHGIPTYYPGQAHLPVAVSAAAAPIPSTGPAPMSNSAPTNQMIMYAHGMPPHQMIPQQPYYPPPPAYYGPPGAGQGHVPFGPVDIPMSETYVSHHSPSQNHHKHDGHHNSAHSTTSSQGSGQNYGKGRRKQQQQTSHQQHPPQHNYYYQPYYQQMPYYNQQQLQSVTGNPIFVGPHPGTGMYIPHAPPHGMYNQGHTDHQGNISQPMPPLSSNDMGFAQQPPVSHVYQHGNHSGRNYNHSSSSTAKGSTSSVPPPLQSDSSEPRTPDSRSAIDKSSPSSEPSALDTSHSSNSNGILASPSDDAQTSTLESVEASNASDVVSQDASNSQETVAVAVGDSTVDTTTVSKKSGGAKSEKKVELATKKPSESVSKSVEVVSEKVEDNHKVNIPCPGSSNTSPPVSSNKHVNGDVKTVPNRDKSSADLPPSLPQNENSTPPSSVSEPVNCKAETTTEDNLNTAKVSEQKEQKPLAPASRSWASIASVKTPNIPNNGANYVNGRQVGIDLRSSEAAASTPSALGDQLAGKERKEGFDLASEMDFAMDEFDPVAYRLGEHVAKYALDHQSISLAPRGLYNQSNSCFVNAILQALLACPPFVNIFRSMFPILDRAPCKAAPVTQNVFEFVREFTPLVRTGATKKDKSRETFMPGQTLEPAGIRKCLALLSKDTFKEEGRQEDAEEFLSFLLNILHDEMIKVAKFCERKKEKHFETPAPPPPPVAPVNGIKEIVNPEDDDDDQWQVMGAKNKSCLTRRTVITKSPISEAFLGQMCLSLSKVNSLKKAHLEPFFTLPLAIQNDNIKSVKDALEAISVKEEVSGMTSANGSEVEAWRQGSLEELPPILILHLKRFVYEKNGIRKINKKLDYSVDLEISKELLSNTSKNRYTPKQRQYKLFAVVYHDGEDAHKGHYVTDCFHPSGGTAWGNWGWLRYDDTSVKPVSEANMLNPSPPRVPYLLLYRRQDTIVLQQSKKGP